MNTITAKSSNKVADLAKNGNVLLPVSVPMPKTATYKSDVSHIDDTVKEYAKKSPFSVHWCLKAH